MIILFPDKKYILRSSLPVDELKKNMQKIVGPELIFQFLRSSSKKYKGRLFNNRFIIRRVIFPGNSFLPVITGRFIDKNGYREVHVSLRLHPAVHFFIIVWFLGLLIIFAGLMFSLIKQGRFEFASLIPVGMAYMSYSLIIYLFKSECNIAEKDLIDTLQAECVIPAGSGLV